VGELAAFDRWLADGLAPDDHDRAAGRLLADAWRDRRRALDRATPPRSLVSERVRRVWWWAPLAVVAIAVVAVVSWPVPLVVDDAVLAEAYLDAMSALPLGAP
jgi:hypothetical protein